MPDFQTVVVRAPYEVDIVLGCTRRRVRVDESFEIPVPSLSIGDTRRAATVMMVHAGSWDQVDFVAFGGRLFRPYLALDQRGFWTPDRCRQDPPGMDFAERLGSRIARTALLGSPFRPSYVDVPDAYRRQARRRAPAALEEARARATRIAQAGLVFVEGVLFQETRTPGWGAHPHPASAVSACLPDFTEAPGLTLVDPGHQIGDVDQVFGRAGCVERDAEIEVFKPDLLPRTTERDALGCLAVHPT
jgi:hypothetical protein